MNETNNVEIQDDPIADLLENIEKEAEDKRAKVNELNDKKLEVELHRVKNQHSKMKEAMALKEEIENINIDLNNRDYVKKLQKENQDYLYNVKEKCMRFLNADFDGAVPYMPNNMILVGARTGRGKSTTCANLAYQALMSGKKVLNISNEERANDVYNRITALIREEAYTDHATWTKERIDTYTEYIEKLSQRMLVIDDGYIGKTGGASYLEVVIGLINKAVESEDFDVILIDYYQKINQSSENPQLGIYEVQNKFADYMGDILKDSRCPAIVVMAQLKPDDKEGKPMEERVEGRKSIMKPATGILEAAPDYNRHCTKFTIHKTRWSEFNDKEIDVGYVKGKYVKYDSSFKEYVEKLKLEKQQKQLLSNVKPANTLGD